MHARRILSLAVSAGLVASSVFPAVAPTSAFAYLDVNPPIWISGGNDDKEHDKTEVSVNVGNYVYENGEAAPFVIGSDDEVAVKLTLGYDYRAGSYDLCMRHADGSVEVLTTQPVTWSTNTAGMYWPVAQDFTLKVSGAKITKTGSVFVRIPNDNDPPKTEIAVPLNIMELDLDNTAIPSNLDLGLESAAFRIPGGINIIGGSTITFGRGSIPFKTKVEKDGTRTNTVGIDDTTFNTWGGIDELEALTKAQQDYSNLVGTGSGGIGFKNFVPTWKLAAVYRWNNQIPRKNGASMAFSYGLRGGVTGQYLIFTADLDFTGLLGFRGSYSVDYNGNSKLAVGPTGSLTARLGVGLGASFLGRVGAYGQLTLDAWYLLLPEEDTGWESATLTGKLGAEAVLLGKRVYDWPIATGGPWYIVKPSHPYLVTASARELLDGAGLKDGFASADADVLGEELSRAYLAHTSAWLGGEDVRAEGTRALVTAAQGEAVTTAAASVQPRVLQEGGYPDAQVNIAETPAGKVMVWLRDDPSRGDANRSQLVWSRYDESSNSWSEPQPVASDNTADFDPTLYVDEAGTAHVAWLDAAEPLADDLTLEQTAERVGMSYAKLESGASSFGATEQVAPPEAGEAKAAPELAAADGSVAVGWATYETSHLLDVGGTHDVVLASRGQDGWSARKVVDATSAAISSLGVGVLDGTLNVAWTEDADGDLTGQDDTRLLSVDVGLGEPVVLAQGGVSNVQFATNAGAGALTWRGRAASSDDALATAAAAADEPEGEDALWNVTALGGEPKAAASGVSLPSSYQVDGDLATGAVVSRAAISDGGARVYARTLSASDGLGAEGLLLTHADNITSWDVINHGDDLSAVFAAERGLGSGENEADLCVVEDQNPRYMQLDNVMVSGDQVPGGTVEISGEVTNVGARTLNGVTMRLLEKGDFRLVESFEGEIKPGETREVRLKYILPDDFTYDPDRTFELHACFYGTAGTANSASAQVPLTGAARLGVEAHDAPYGEKEKVFVELTNHGTQPTSGTVHFLTVGEDGQEVELETGEFGPIGAGETAYLGMSPDDVATFSEMGINYLSARVEPAQDAEELYTGTYTWTGELLPVSGEPVETGWEYEDGTWYVGVSAEGRGSWHKTGWHWDNGWYYLDPEADGALASGWREVDGKRYWLNTRHDGHFGRMATGWVFVDGAWYLAASSGALRYGWAWDDATKAWYYLRADDGQMLRDITTPDGLQVDGTGRWVG